MQFWSACFSFHLKGWGKFWINNWGIWDIFIQSPLSGVIRIRIEYFINPGGGGTLLLQMLTHKKTMYSIDKKLHVKIVQVS